MNRIEFLKGTMASLAFLSLYGCITRQLYEEHHEYDETALSFLVTEDGSTLVVLGKSYHYIFRDITPSLKQILMGQLRTVVAVSLSNFYVRRDNIVTGDYTVSLAAEASDEERRLAMDAGFGLRWGGFGVAELALSGHLEGVRYDAAGFPKFSETQQFTRPYVVSIREQDLSSRLAAKILVTPVTVAMDGIVILGGAALIFLVLGGSGPHVHF